jgi:hypothetical protein
MKYEDLPFSRGATFFNGETIPSTLVTGDQGGGFNLEGKEYVHEDVTYGTGFYVRVRAVRNSSAHNILPGQLVDLSATTNYYSQTVKPGTNVLSQTTTANTYSFPADEFLPAAGVPPGDVFWIVVSGPCQVKTTTGGTPTLSVFQKVEACSATSYSSVDAGCVDGITSGASALLFSNAVGRSLQSITSGGTGASVLIGVGW